MYVPIVKNLLRKLGKGTYDPSKAVKLWMYYVDENAKMYAKEYSAARDWNTIFNKNTRLLVAKKLEEYVRDEMQLGNWD